MATVVMVELVALLVLWVVVGVVQTRVTLAIAETLALAETQEARVTMAQAQQAVMREVLAQTAIRGMLVLMATQMLVVQEVQETQEVQEIQVPLEPQITLI